jgi:hypothetical protein
MSIRWPLPSIKGALAKHVAGSSHRERIRGAIDALPDGDVKLLRGASVCGGYVSAHVRCRRDP